MPVQVDNTDASCSVTPSMRRAPSEKRIGRIVGSIRLENRVVMAPETETARYVARRAGAGLIVTGSIAISAWARIWAFEPGRTRRRRSTRGVV